MDKCVGCGKEVDRPKASIPVCEACAEIFKRVSIASMKQKLKDVGLSSLGGLGLG